MAGTGSTPPFGEPPAPQFIETPMSAVANGQVDSETPELNGANPSGSRRPPRKSTLTQQQKNQKRQRATQDQLVTLEVEFNKNPTPTATVRERIASEINMTERSVQIWFQNRRAKIKLLAKKSIETGEDCDAIPDSMRQYLANQAMESGKPLGGDFLSRPGSQMSTYGSGGMFFGDPAQTGKIVIHHFTCKSLSIGSWRRVGQNAMDLVVFYAPDKASLTYYINNEGAGYKIEYPFASIKNITLESSDGMDDSMMTQRPRGILVELSRPPNFFMDSAGTGGFHQCGDFTEDQQASSVMLHHLGGHPKVLAGQLAKLVSLESFQNRHNPFERQNVATSAPVSPMGPPRPSSQPNQMAHPHLALFQEQGFGMQPPPRGHKRQRSRSVPIAVDFSSMPPMPSLHVQKPSVNMTDADNIFAPIPQHSNNHLGPLGPNLRIDTSSGYGMEYRQYPQSAATTNSQSEFASPSFFSSGSHVENVPASSYNQPYSLPFLSPMGEHPPAGINPSVSPLSSYSHGDPVIANGSPPMGEMHRSPSADFLSLAHDNQDDGLMLSDLYAKQNLNLSMPSPNHPLDDSDMKFGLQEESSSEELDMSNMVHFGDMQNSSLSPEHISTGLQT